MTLMKAKGVVTSQSTCTDRSEWCALCRLLLLRMMTLSEH